MRIIDVINTVRSVAYPRRGRQAYLIIRVEGLPGNASRETVQAHVGSLGITPYFVALEPNPNLNPLQRRFASPSRQDYLREQLQ